MIIRSALTCSTCDHHHVVRIGMGHETRHVHKFPCRNCGEDIEVALEVDFERIGTRTVPVANCELSENVWGSEIVNLDPNFIIRPEHQGRDQVFPRMSQMHALAKKAEEMGGAFQPVSLDDPRLRQRPYRRPDYFAEWTELKRAWTLRRRGQDVFSRNIIRKATETFYPDQPLQGLADWLYRLASQIMGRAGMESFRFAAARIDEATRKPEFSALVAHYNSQMATKRGRKYLSIVSEYFDSYSEFSQVQFLMAGGVLPDAHFRVTSTDFNKTKMFYGNGFEILADQIDFIALVNNVLSGRKFDRFSELSLKRYYEIDKSGRANCFVADVALATFTAEFDNQIRNASHHGGMEFDAFSQTISYRAGKGGTGPEQQMTYTAYLTKCVEVFSQVLRLLMIELVLTQQVGLDEPL